MTIKPASSRPNRARIGNDHATATHAAMLARSRDIRENVRHQYALLHDRQRELHVAMDRFRTRQAELLFDGISL